MSIADFHTHSTRSDGILPPAELVRLAASRGVRLLALTDHDSMEGIPEALEAARQAGLLLIPGIEMSTDIPDDEAHVLGYFLDPSDEALQAELARMREARFDRGRRMVAKLNEMGVPVRWERVQEIAGDASVGRPHVARALLEGGWIASFDEAFERYIGRNGPAYAERDKLTPADAVRFILDHGGVAVLAHPREIATLEPVLDQTVEAGLAGMEVYYRSYSEDDIARLASVASAWGLFPLGGSDYHGQGSEGERLPGDIPLPDAAIAHFLDESARLIGEERIAPYRVALASA
ncbi:MAG TPA: PHP domain-containing protein [Dehalococcoidia bacterium]|nr:PHP domain-containing protein [Dehalococcoidia bacterium]